MVSEQQASPDQYAVFGNPISHSLSPAIHSLFAQQCDQAIEYKAIKVEIDRFAETTDEFFQNGGLGLSITVPFKEQAYEFVNRLTDRAERAGAVNTILFDGEYTIGDNTDGVGLVNDLMNNHKAVIQNKKILILGAGGAVKGVLGPLLEQSPLSITICNRTVSKAEELAKVFSSMFTIDALSYEALTAYSFDIVINGTSTSLHGQLPPLPNALFNPDAISYDMMYSKQHTVFQQWSLNKGALYAVDGLGMLVEQAAEAFNLWRGIRPETGPVIQTLR